MILAILSQSIKDAAARWRWALALTAANFVLAVILAVPFALFIRHVNDSTLLGERLTKDEFDLVWLLEAVNQWTALDRLVTRTALLALPVFAAFWLLNVFLTGGIIGLFRPKSESEPGKNFLDDCLTHFVPLVAASILEGVLYLGILLAHVSCRAFVAEYDSRSLSETPVVRMRLALLVLTVGGFALVRLFLDYVKIGVVLGGARSLSRQCVATGVFFARHGLNILTLFSASGLLWAVVVGFSTWAAASVPSRGPLWIALVFLLQQTAIFLRNWTRLVFLAGQCRLHDALAPRPEFDFEQSSPEASQIA